MQNAMTKAQKTAALNSIFKKKTFPSPGTKKRQIVWLIGLSICFWS